MVFLLFWCILCIHHSHYVMSSLLPESERSSLVGAVGASSTRLTNNFEDDQCQPPDDKIPLTYPLDMGIHWSTSGEWWNVMV
jgi:hypothetical protein